MTPVCYLFADTCCFSPYFPQIPNAALLRDSMLLRPPEFVLRQVNHGPSGTEGKRSFLKQ